MAASPRPSPRPVASRTLGEQRRAAADAYAAVEALRLACAATNPRLARQLGSTSAALESAIPQLDAQAVDMAAAAGARYAQARRSGLLSATSATSPSGRPATALEGASPRAFRAAATSRPQSSPTKLGRSTPRAGALVASGKSSGVSSGSSVVDEMRALRRAHEREAAAARRRVPLSSRSQNGSSRGAGRPATASSGFRPATASSGFRPSSAAASATSSVTAAALGSGVAELYASAQAPALWRPASAGTGRAGASPRAFLRRQQGGGGGAAAYQRMHRQRLLAEERLRAEGGSTPGRTPRLRPPTAPSTMRKHGAEMPGHSRRQRAATLTVAATGRSEGVGAAIDGNGEVAPAQCVTDELHDWRSSRVLREFNERRVKHDARRQRSKLSRVQREVDWVRSRRHKQKTFLKALQEEEDAALLAKLNARRRQVMDSFNMNNDIDGAEVTTLTAEQRESVMAALEEQRLEEEAHEAVHHTYSDDEDDAAVAEEALLTPAARRRRPVTYPALRDRSSAAQRRLDKSKKRVALAPAHVGTPSVIMSFAMQHPAEFDIAAPTSAKSFTGGMPLSLLAATFNDAME